MDERPIRMYFSTLLSGGVMAKAATRSELIPTFELYGEAPAETLPQVHIETISSRSR